MSEELKKFVKIPNPYDPYDFNTGRSYYSKEVVENLKKAFESVPPQKIVYLQGKEGSGKSSTLNRIKTDPGILGERYIPIYVDAKNITDEKNVNTLVNLYEILRKPLHEHKIQTKNIHKERISLEDIRQTLVELTQLISQRDKIFLLIFDDLDSKFLIENKETSRTIIHTLIKVCKNSDKFRIILSGSDDIPETQHHTDSIMETYQENFQTIKMLVVDPQDFKRLIVEPVQGYAIYNQSALDEIKRITGGNLYCQQYLCHYIIRQLNNREKYNCDKDDVNAAAQLMIKDRREDFDHFWSKLDLEHKLVCSALMDENIVFSRGDSYFIDAATLLDEIFGPLELKYILNRLYVNDFIHQPDGREFKGFPFKIPLFGHWIKERHPFIKTVVENIVAIANLKDPARLVRITEKISEHIFPPNHREIIKILREWLDIQNILTDKGWIDNERTGELARFICKILGLTIRKEFQQEMGYFVVDFSGLNIGSIKEAVLVSQDRLEWSQTDSDHFISTVLPYVQPTLMPCLLFCFIKNDKIVELEKKAFLNTIPVEGLDLKNILFSNHPRQALREILFKRIPSVQLSPYKIAGPAITTFYGRLKELRKILGTSSQNFIILGARRIGKSSLIMRVKTSPDNPGVTSIYIDLESPPNHDYKTFLDTIGKEIGKCFNKKSHFKSLDMFVKEMQKLKDEQKKMMIILDEVDELLKFDKQNDYQFIKALRNLSHYGCCQFILSGFEVLYNSKREIDSPLYNFGEEMLLGPLEKQYALDLITEPMTNIGIDYKQPEDRELILEYTSCHPNLLQFFCKQLIEKISKDTNRRIIYREDINELFDFEYENYIFNEFYMFYNDLDELEKLIVLILAKDVPHEKEFNMAFINQVLKNRGVDLLEDVIHKACQKLMLRFIFSEGKQGRYTFALPHFPEAIRKRDEYNLVDDLSRSLIARLKEKYHGKS